MLKAAKDRKSHITGQRGFSLLEILVAFSILALSLTVLLNIFSSGIQSAMVSEEYANAVQIAESLLATTGVESKLQEGKFQGVIENYNWEISVNPYDPELGELDAGFFSDKIYRVLVRVSWGEDEETPRSVSLETLKLAARSK